MRAGHETWSGAGLGPRDKITLRNLTAHVPDLRIGEVTSVPSVPLFHNPRMGNLFSERIRPTDQPYHRYPGASSPPGGNRNPRPGHPGASLLQDENRIPQPGSPGASSQQDENRIPQLGSPGASSQQDENRISQLGPPGASSQQDENRNEGMCLSILSYVFKHV